VSEEIVEGVDGYKYRRLSGDEITALYQDVQFYWRAASGQFAASLFTPRTWGTVAPSSWNSEYYIRLDTSKPEYTPEESNR
jgi:hypothetical protein